MPNHPSIAALRATVPLLGRARSLLVFGIAFSMLSTVADGATLDVCQTRAAAFASIQDAVDAASDGDVVEICAGVHVESSIFVHGKDLTILGRGQDRTFVEPPAPGPIFTVFGPAEVTFRGLTVRNGESYDGGALEVVHGEVTLMDCSFVSNTAFDSGGAVSLDRGAGLVVSNCNFEDNSAGRFGGAINARRAEIVVVTNSLFSGNVARDGGAVEISEAGEVVIAGSGFSGNAAASAGGALAVTDSGSLILNRSTVVDNPAGRRGGIRIEDLATEALVENCEIVDDDGTVALRAGGPALSLR